MVSLSTTRAHKIPVFLWQAKSKFIFWEIFFIIWRRILIFFYSHSHFMFLFFLENICSRDIHERLAEFFPGSQLFPPYQEFTLRKLIKCRLFIRLKHFHVTIPTMNIISTDTAKIIASEDEWILLLIQDLFMIWLLLCLGQSDDYIN